MEIKLGNTTLWLNLEEYQYQKEWYEYREKLLHLVGIWDVTPEMLDQAEEYLFTKYPQYRKFKIDAKENL